MSNHGKFGAEPGLAGLSAPFVVDEQLLLPSLIASAHRTPEDEARIDTLAADLIEAIRSAAGGLGGVEAMLREYSLSTKEGLALMVLAESLLRVPDAATADLLIGDKLDQGGFATRSGGSTSIVAQASAWALGLSARIVMPNETPAGVLASATRRLGVPTIRAAARQAMRIMGDHFVLGETIEAALKRAGKGKGRLFRYSFDMLGEGARTADDATTYETSYRRAIESIGRAAGRRALPDRPGIAIKLSALHPRYEALNRERVLAELVPRVLSLAQAAKAHDLNLTIDAEEADRLELSLEVFAAVLADASLAGWDGFGLAIQAYQTRSLAVIDHIDDLARRFGRRLMVRLVKGAYWDSEIKRAQERGLDGYPVFTSKGMTDLAYDAAAAKLLACRPRLFPQFATHNALTIASILTRVESLDGDFESFEFQRLHGMGDALYRRLLDAKPGVACRTYAPVGGHKDLLAYLVRRLLENGANSSFVAQASDPTLPIEVLLRRPEAIVAGQGARRPLPLPCDLFAPSRRNSKGVEFGCRTALDHLMRDIAENRSAATATSIVDGQPLSGAPRVLRSPIDGVTAIGTATDASEATADAAMTAAAAGARAWAATDAAHRADALDRMADALEHARGRLVHLLQVEAGKTIDDAISELREAVDFCRYYAIEARRLFGRAEPLPGPVGESNRLTLRARGVVVAISPWNFPMAIFVGQVAAALVAGNAVVAKPAEQTPLIAAEAVRMLHAAGIPVAALHLVIGPGEIGARLVAHACVDGIVFTGSTQVARSINRTLADKEGAIVPLIAETGGINAMIVDATALPEQVTDDVVASAFRSAGQRCSALRLLIVQADVADKMIAMIVGATREMRLGDPRDPSTHIGPVIDAEAQHRLATHWQAMSGANRVHFEGTTPTGGSFFAPRIIELDAIGALEVEAFGPILHVVRYEAGDLDAVLDAIDAKGFGLTLGLHTRIDATIERVVARLRTGNIYVNRNMIGAVVGSQPFGGSGLSGTGPKAGGPHYLPRFAIEQTVTINTAAAGGDVDLMASG